MSKIKGAVIADVHIGAFDLQKMKTEHELFFSTLDEEKKLDLIVVDGDLTHYKFFLNAPESVYTAEFLSRLFAVAEDKGAKLRFVYGTESHENDQYETLLPKNSNVDYKLIKHVYEEEIFPDVNVLYIPEEHLNNQEEYYSEFFKEAKKYDYVFGHGVIREAMKEAALSIDNKGNAKTVPVFSSGALKRICKGDVYFGHYHTATDMDGVYYVGSYSRWMFGQEEAKGFYLFSFNQDKEEYSNEFIENTISETFHTITFGYNDAIFKDQSELEKEMDKLDSIMSEDLYDNVRFMVNVPEDIENPEFTVKYLKERYKNPTTPVQLKFVHGYTEKSKERAKEEVGIENNQTTSLYDFIFDRSLSTSEKVHNFIQIQFEKDVPVDRIECYTYMPLKDILDSVEIDTDGNGDE